MIGVWILGLATLGQAPAPTKDAPPPGRNAWTDEAPAEKFVPAKPISEADKTRIEADKLFAVGFMHFKRQELADALQNFREALRKNPKHLASLQTAAMAAAQLERREEALDYCKRAVALSPKDADRLYLAGLILAARDDRAEALDVLEKARAVPGLADSHPGRYVSIREVLVELYRRTDDASKIADVVGEIIAVAENPDRYELDPANRRSLGKQRSRYYLLRAESLRKAKRYPEALADLRRLIEKEPGQRRPLLVDIAQTQAESGDNAAALTTLDEYFALGDSRLPAAFELWAKLLDRMGKKADLLPRLEKLVNQQPGSETAARMYAKALFENRQYDRAARVLRGLPVDKETLPMLLRSYIQLKRGKELAETIGGMVKASPDERETDAIVELVVRDKQLLREVGVQGLKLEIQEEEDRERTLYVLAHLQMQGGEYSRAAEYYSRLLLISPNAKEHHYRLTYALLRAEKFRECIAAADKALAQFADDVDLVEVKTSAMSKLGKLDDAVKLLEALAKKLGDDERLVKVQLTLGFTYQQAQKFDEAIKVYRKLIDDHPAPPDVHEYRYYLAGVMSLAGKTKDAETELKKIVDANPPAERRIQAGANNDLGYQWADENRNLDKAEEMIALALKLDGDNPAYLDSMGWVLFKRAKYKDAKDYLERAATSRAGDDPVVWDHLGDCQHKLGDKKAAAEAWANAVHYYGKGNYAAQKHKAEPIAAKAAAALGKDWRTLAPMKP